MECKPSSKLCQGTSGSPWRLPVSRPTVCTMWSEKNQILFPVRRWALACEQLGQRLQQRRLVCAPLVCWDINACWCTGSCQPPGGTYVFGASDCVLAAMSNSTAAAYSKRGLTEQKHRYIAKGRQRTEVTPSIARLGIHALELTQNGLQICPMLRWCCLCHSCCLSNLPCLSLWDELEVLQSLHNAASTAFGRLHGTHQNHS